MIWYLLIYLQEKYRVMMDNPDNLDRAMEREAIMRTFERVREMNDSHFEPTQYDAVKKITDEFFKEL